MGMRVAWKLCFDNHVAGTIAPRFRVDHFTARKDDMEIGFNSRFLIEMLNNLEGSEVKLAMSEPSRAGLLMPAKKITILY